MPLLKRIGIGINKEKASVLIWGGLRGAVSLALALTIGSAVAQSNEDIVGKWKIKKYGTNQRVKPK
ncbi:MAG: hypothetical protein IH991_10735, partial [Planctomycetes bacterium]|nr:hypothetical protein [Planctomycetota bacterium]